MSFTKNERFIISNQMKILEKLDADNAKEYQRTKLIFDEGFEEECEEAMEHIKERLVSEYQRDVRSILNIYSILRRSFDSLEDKSQINEEDVKFPGYETNDDLESAMAKYAEFLVTGSKNWSDAVKGQSLHWQYKSLVSKLKKYQRMIAKWEALRSQVKAHMSEAQMRAILDA